MRGLGAAIICIWLVVHFVPGVSAQQAAGNGSSAAPTKSRVVAARDAASPRISIDIQNGDIRQVLGLVGREQGWNVVVSDSVKGSITIVMRDVPASEILQAIYQQKGLVGQVEDGVLVIRPRAEAAEQDRLSMEMQQQRQAIGPLRQQAFHLRFAQAVDLEKLVRDQLTVRGKVSVDSRTNTLFVNDTGAKIGEIAELIRAVDQPIRQVLIEARIVEANETFNEELGVRLGALDSVRTGGGLQLGGGQYVPPTQAGQALNYNRLVPGSSSSSPTYQTLNSVNGQPFAVNQTLGAVNLPTTRSAAGTLAFALLNPSGSKILNVELSALESDGRGKIISSPKVVTGDNVKAVIEDGSEIPYLSTAQTGGTTIPTVEFKKAVLSLDVTPQITPDGKVRLKLVVRKEEPDYATMMLIPGSTNPPIKSTVVTTDVLVENGGTVSIGGVFIKKVDNLVTQVPFLGDIPFIGNLFKYRSTTEQRRELLVFISPQIVAANP
jgi:type IV pilus assembly protein PilQ